MLANRHLNNRSKKTNFLSASLLSWVLRSFFLLFSILLSSVIPSPGKRLAPSFPSYRISRKDPLSRAPWYPLQGMKVNAEDITHALEGYNDLLGRDESLLAK